MKSENFYRLKVLAGFIAFFLTGGWLFFASQLNSWAHFYAFAQITIFLMAAFLPTTVYFSQYSILVGAIYVLGIIVGLQDIFIGFTSLKYGSDKIGDLLGHIYLLVLFIFARVSIMKGKCLTSQSS